MVIDWSIWSSSSSYVDAQKGRWQMKLRFHLLFKQCYHEVQTTNAQWCSHLKATNTCRCCRCYRSKQMLQRLTNVVNVNIHDVVDVCKGCKCKCSWCCKRAQILWYICPWCSQINELMIDSQKQKTKCKNWWFRMWFHANKLLPMIIEKIYDFCRFQKSL